MPYREVTMLEIKEVLRLWLSGLGKKPIARQLGLDPKTVRRYLLVAAGCGLAQEQGPDALTEERLVAVLAALTPAPEHPHGDTWALCQKHRTFLAALLEKRVRLTKVRKLLRRRHDVVVPYATLHRFAVTELGFGRRATTIPSPTVSPAKRSSSTPTGWGGWSPTPQASAAGCGPGSSPPSAPGIASSTPASRRRPPPPSKPARRPGNSMEASSGYHELVITRIISRTP